MKQDKGKGEGRRENEVGQRREKGEEEKKVRDTSREE